GTASPAVLSGTRLRLPAQPRLFAERPSMLPRHDRDRLQARAESQQAAVAILHDELARVPRSVAQFARELHASRCILGVKRVCIFNTDVSVEQFVGVFVWTGFGRFRAAKVNRLLISRNNSVDGRVLPRADALESQLALVIRQRAQYVQAKKLRRNPPYHARQSTTGLRGVGFGGGDSVQGSRQGFFVFDVEGGDGAFDLAKQAGEDFAGANFDEGVYAFIDQGADGFFPADRHPDLADERFAGFFTG